MIETEILAPAGSIDTLYAGINAGADAVYIGGSRFGARAYAESPEEYDLLNALDYVHFNNKKIYLTVNTLLKNNEIEQQLFSYLEPLYKQGLDAVIVQDLGVFSFIRNNFPDMDIHASTQMAVMGVNSAKMLKKLGASRVVTARELSLSELKEIHNNVDIEIESFIHGAMCYSYSGMCLFSSMIGGRSGNRGRCAGPCRQPYEVFSDGKRINDNNNLYTLSLKDMNTLEIIPEIINSGVYSLKIEGRMKSPEYAAGVVEIYRKYVDLFYEKGNNEYRIEKKDLENLANLYSRSGSTTGYYKTHNSRKMISLSKPAYRTENENFTNEINLKYCSGRKQKEVNAYVQLEAGAEAKLTISSEECSVSVFGNIVDNALKRPIDKENVVKQLSKTGDSLLKFHKIDINMNKNIFVPVKQLNELRRQAIDEYTNEYLKSYRHKNEISQKLLKSTWSQQNMMLQETPTLICAVNSLEQLKCVLDYSEIDDIYISTDRLSSIECINAVKLIGAADKNTYIMMPYIYRRKGREYMEKLFSNIKIDDIKGFVIRNVDELGLVTDRNISNYVVDNTLYSFNKYSYEFFKKNGAARITLPYELNYKELKKLSYDDNELVVYGRIPLMISANCINNTFNGCDKISKDFSLKDRIGINFSVYNCCNFCYNIIYNNVPLSLMGQKEKITNIVTKNYRLNFTTESFSETKNILEKYIKVFYYNECSEEIKDFTRGHFNRGVE